MILAICLTSVPKSFKSYSTSARKSSYGTGTNMCLYYELEIMAKYLSVLCKSLVITNAALKPICYVNIYTT